MKLLYSPLIPDFNSITSCVDMKNKMGPKSVTSILERIKEIDWTKEAINSVLMEQGEKDVANRKKLMNVLRVALTGTNKGFVGIQMSCDLGIKRNDRIDR
jgi:hypothetical protein